MTPPLEKRKIRRASANPISGYWVPVENKKRDRTKYSRYRCGRLGPFGLAEAFSGCSKMLDGGIGAKGQVSEDTQTDGFNRAIALRFWRPTSYRA